MKYGTEEQKAAYLKFQKEEEERKKIAEERKAEMKPIEKAINNLKNNDLYIEPRAKRSKKAKTLNALGKAEEKRLQGILEQIQTKHDNRYGQPYSPVDKTPIGTPLTSSPKDKPVVSKKKANESVISNTKKDKSLIDEEVRNITPDIKAYALPSMLNLDLGTEKEVDVAGNIDPSGGEINEIEVVNSINRLNDYMTETPKIHQIIG